MEIPAPVNLSALQGILAKSAQVMKKVEEKSPTISKPSMNESYDSYDSYDTQDSYGSGGYNENDEKNMMYEGYSAPAHDPTKVTDYTDDQVMNSNLPAAIKEAMLKNRIPKLSGPPSKFTAEDISKLTGAPIKKPNQPQQQQQRQPISENRQPQSGDMITVSKAQLQDMIDEGISRFFKQTYDKTLTEETIRKTINLLIKDGKIGVKKKII